MNSLQIYIFHSFSLYLHKLHRNDFQNKNIISKQNKFLSVEIISKFDIF